MVPAVFSRNQDAGPVREESVGIPEPKNRRVRDKLLAAEEKGLDSSSNSLAMSPPDCKVTVVTTAGMAPKSSRSSRCKYI